MKKDHVDDYDSIFGRVELNLGQQVSTKTTDALLTAYKNKSASDAERRYLEILLFQYGRYLTMGSSRKAPDNNARRATLPSNLQGIWVGANNSAWHSDYHMNVNLQMNYWPTYVTNMAECAEPLIDYVDSLREPGRVTAKIYAGIESTTEKPENGFMAHTQNNPFGWTCPGWSFNWGWSPAAVPWILQNCWEHYEFTGDVDYMKKHIYPMLKEEAVLYDQMLIRDTEGKLVSAPSYSPEHGPRTAGNTYEQTLVWQLYEDAIKAAEILKQDPEKVAEWKSNQKDLKGPIEIGTSGQIKEWYIEEAFNKDAAGNNLGEGAAHRHISHILGLFPGDLIATNPEWMEAAKYTMQNRLDRTTGWGMGQRINTWARLGDGNHAHSLIETLFGSGILTNLWDTHAPYQIDGNFGMTSGVAEMLLQSNMGYINLLPALPDAWAEGNVDGLVARGNFEVDMSWTGGSLTEASIHSKNGGPAVVNVPNASFGTLTDGDGNTVQFERVGDNQDQISFNTEKGKTYVLKEVPPRAAAPTGLTAERSEAERVELAWDAVEGEGITYKVYRQVGNGQPEQIADALTETTYVDAGGNETLGNLKYRVSAMVDGRESAVSEAIAVSDLRNMAGMIDDLDPRIKYTGAWGNWTENTNYAGTIKYLNSPQGGETASLTFVGTGIEVIVCTNTDRGKYEVFIDGVSQGVVDTYSATTVRQKTVFSKTDLTHGKHTIRLVVKNEKVPQSSGTKVELDAFKVLDNTLAPQPTQITVSSETGMTTVGKANSSLQLAADVLPANAEDKTVTWSVSDQSLAEIDENGLLTVKNKNGIVRVTATANADEHVTGTFDVTVAIAGGEEAPSTEIIDDGTPPASGNTGTKNEAITWNGSWSNYAGERNKHYGGTKTECTGEGSYFEYTFTGTGIQIYAQKHANFASYDVTLDGVNKGNVSLEGSGSGEPQQLIAEYNDLENTQHTIRCTIKARSGKAQANLDYLKVFRAEASDKVDKAGLQDTILEAFEKEASDYPQTAWTAFQAVYREAVGVMNDADATEQEVAQAKKELEDAMADLDAVPVKNIVSVVNPKAKEVAYGTTYAQLQLPERVTVNLEGGDTAEAGVTWAQGTYNGTKPGTYKLTGTLTVSGTITNTANKKAEISVTVKAREITSVVNPAIKEAAYGTAFAELALPTEVTVNLSNGDTETVRVTWAQGTYDGTKAGTYVLDGTLTSLPAGIENPANKKAQITVKVNEQAAPPAEVREIVSVVNPKALEVAYGTAYETLNLPAKVTVNFKTGEPEQLAVTWAKGSYDGTKEGTYTLQGELTVVEGIVNTNDVKAEVKVVVQEKSVVPEKPSKDELEAKLKEAEQKSEEHYSSASWKKLQTAYEKAQAVFADEQAAEQEIQTAYDALRAAIEEMDYELKVREGLTIYFGDYKSYYKKENHSEANWAAYEQAMKAVENVLADKEASTEEMLDALDALEAAAAKLNEELDKEDPKAPEVPEIPEAPKPEQPGNSAATGDKLNPIPFVLLLAAAIIVVVVIKKKRK